MNGNESRTFWIQTMTAIARPVLETLSRRQLYRSLPMEFHSERKEFACLEAFGRTLCGIAPWLECDGLSGEEEALRKHFCEMALQGLDAATDPNSPDYMLFDGDGQPLVDAAFLAHGLIRAPKALIGGMSDKVRHQMADALRSSRKITPPHCNWLFFSAMVEAALYRMGEEYDLTRVTLAARTFESWYLGDGVYGDGPEFHWDYYNSFVIQPMYVDILRTFAPVSRELAQLLEPVQQRAARYAAILERMIAPDGTYPIIGRSICYRFGAFQQLSQAALEHMLPAELSPAQVRCALTAVIQRVMACKGIFDENGWLTPGVGGCQPGLAEHYINRGSLYLCCSVFLALGLSPEDSFWANPAEPWTSVKIWQGTDLPADHAL